MSSKILNIEIKAKCHNPEEIKKSLLDKNADFKGIDHQIDTYFNCRDGRLKLRTGNIENSLIFYQRSNQAGPKASHVSLTKLPTDNNLKQTLSLSNGVMVEVDKQRGIYFIDNVKFHVDEVKGLGWFVEIEAIDTDGSIGEEKLLEQCHLYMKLLNIHEKDLIEKSYSDLLLP